MTKRKQIIILSILVVFLISGLAFLLVVGKRSTRITPRAEEAPQVTLGFVDTTPDDPTDKSVDVIVTVNDPALNEPDGAGVGIITSTISYSGAIDNLDSTPVSINGWTISLTKDDTEPKITLFANQNIMDPASEPIKGTAVLGTFAFTLTGEQADLNYADDAYVADSNGNDLVLITEHLSISPQPAQGATLKLVPATGQVNAEDTQSVDIVLDTNDNGIAGVEAVIEYNKNLLSITSKDQIIPAPDVPDNPYPEDFDLGSYVIKIGLSSSDPINKGRLSVDTIIPVDSSDGLNRQDILVARINFATAAGTTGTAHVEYLCVSPPLPTGEFSSSYACDPNPEIEDFSLVSLFDVTQPNYEGDGILTRVENGEYEITAPGATPTVTPIITPTPTVITPSSTPTPTVPPPSPTITPQPGQASLRLKLNACNAGEDDLSREVYIKINGAPQQTIAMHNDGTTESFDTPSTPFKLQIMPIGHLPGTFTVTAQDIDTNGIIDLTSKPFIGGNSDDTTAPTGATDLSLTGVSRNDSNRNFDEQIVNTSDFHFFMRNDFDKKTNENPEVLRSDFNCSGKVNVLDYSSILIHWGKTSSD